MPHCSKCGTQTAEGATYCSNCGQPQPTPTLPGTTANNAQTGLSENAAGALSYVLGWITGIIFLLIDKRPYVRFHAAQSIVVFGGLHVIQLAMSMMFGASFFYGGWTGLSAGWMILSVLHILTFVLWIVCMVKAAQGQRFEVPVAAGIAQSFSK